MGGCSGKCDGCGDKPQVINISRGVMRADQKYSESLLNPPKQKKIELKELTGTCTHYTFGQVPKHQCMNCIREWVNTVPVEEAEKLAVEFNEEGRNIAADRIRAAIKERLWDEWHIR